ncbi:hypothetical protein NPIL_177411 [Nephila pilipes]|uniref:Uncharacterized protein n=1 Tax=Nephila pilipes TaxID=299642 RepID=A0A8X6NQ42_NEPPI|nr:hypothetical protein NPIL_177411 [Nephila pilipes]
MNKKSGGGVPSSGTGNLENQDGSHKSTNQCGNISGTISVSYNGLKDIKFNIINCPKASFEIVQESEDGSIKSVCSMKTEMQIIAEKAGNESTANQQLERFTKDISTQTDETVKVNNSSPVVNTSLKPANISHSLIFPELNSITHEPVSFKTDWDIQDVYVRAVPYDCKNKESPATYEKKSKKVTLKSLFQQLVNQIINDFDPKPKSCKSSNPASHTKKSSIFHG